MKVNAITCGLAIAFFCGLVHAAEPTKPDPAQLAATIDRLIQEKIIAQRVPAAQRADDAAFLRRASLSLTGRIPTEERARQFISDNDPKKRQKAIDLLLASPECA